MQTTATQKVSKGVTVITTPSSMISIRCIVHDRFITNQNHKRLISMSVHTCIYAYIIKANVDGGFSDSIYARSSKLTNKQTLLNLAQQFIRAMPSTRYVQVGDLVVLYMYTTVCLLNLHVSTRQQQSITKASPLFEGLLNGVPSGATVICARTHLVL